jgi:hypothetical protein
LCKDPGNGKEFCGILRGYQLTNVCECYEFVSSVYIR